MNPAIWVVLIVLGLFLFIVIYACTVGFSMNSPGVAFQIAYADHAELQEVYNEFQKTCVFPRDLRTSQLLTDPRVQQLRMDILSGDRSNAVDESEPISADGFVERIGHFAKKVDSDLANLATDKIQQLMTRLSVSDQFLDETANNNQLFTYTPTGGAIAFQSNPSGEREGWRLYFTHSSSPGQSWTGYIHPYDQSYRKVYDSNEHAVLMRIRKMPHPLLWQNVYSDNDRFSWSMWIDPELAHKLQENTNTY